MLEILLDGGIGGVTAQVLQIHRNLGTGDIDSDHSGGDLPLHASVDNTSEAVNSTLESGGTLGIATYLLWVW